MVHTISTLSNQLRRGLGSIRFWHASLGVFVLQALWFVFSAQYPMAFDENYHFGLIQLHAAQWLPFFTSQPPDTGAYGAIARDPSYLYHWLMSFPYRLTTVCTHNQTMQIIVLRLINVASFTGGLVLYRKVIRRMGVSSALANGLFALFILVPVVPFLAAHINYDNLLFLVIPLSTLLTLRLLEGVATHHVDARTLLLLVAVLCFGSLVKYPFLPVAVVSVGYVLVRLYRNRLLGRDGWRSFVDGFVGLTRFTRVALVIICLLGIGLFAERYAQNIITYHDPVPACDAVISQDDCMEYGPYARDSHYQQSKPASFHPNIFVYIWEWLYGMWYRLFFAINYNYATAPPLLVISVLAIVLSALAVIGIGLRFKALFAGNHVRQLLLLFCVGYIGALFADGFGAYAKTGQPVAINGRYLIPFLPFLCGFAGLAWSQLLRNRSQLKTAAAGLVIALFVLQGGGVMTFIVRSQDNWMWPNAAVRSVNRGIRNVVSPVIIGKNVY